MAATKKNEKTNAQQTQGQDYETLPDVEEVHGWWSKEIGRVLEGVIIGRAESKFGAYFLIRTAGPVLVKGPEGAPAFTLQAGSNVAVSEVAKMRPLLDKMKRGPVAVRVEITGEREDGKGYTYDVKCRAAF